MKKEMVITRFLALVFMYIHEEKSIDFYAERMNIDALELNALLYDVNKKGFLSGWNGWILKIKPKMSIYFASDLHLIAVNEESRCREKAFIQWLDTIKHDANAVYLLGDMFDFWFEYKTVVTRGFSRFIGKLCELTDSGILVHYFTGNHDIWARDYLASEAGVILHTEPMETEIQLKNHQSKIIHHASV